MTPPICVNCKHYCCDEWDLIMNKCEAPQNLVKREFDLVLGYDVSNWLQPSCRVQRSVSDPTLCGPEGRWFTPKDPAP